MNTTLVKLVACLALTGSTVVMAGDERSASEALSMTQTAEASSMAGLDIDDIEGKDIIDAAGQQLGDVDEVVRNHANQAMAVIGLEDSDREVVVPIDRLTLSADGDKFVTQLTRAELLALPDYDPMDLESVDE